MELALKKLNHADAVFFPASCLFFPVTKILIPG